MSRGILIELPPGDGCDGCCMNGIGCELQLWTEGYRRDEPGPACLAAQAAYRAEVEARERAEAEARGMIEHFERSCGQTHRALDAAKAWMARAENAEAEVIRLMMHNEASVLALGRAEAEAHRACCFIAAMCAEAGRGCAGCEERKCPNHGKEAPHV